MNLRRERNAHRILPWITLLGVLLSACGGGGDGASPDPATPGTPATDTSSLAYKDLLDNATTSLSITTSGERDPATENVRIFALVKDQDGTPVFFLNKYNFGVQLNPGTAPRAVNPSQIVLSTEESSDRLVALVLDSSGSMAALDVNSGLTRLQAAQAAARLYVENMSDGDYAAVVTFSTTARIVQGLTNSKSSLIDAIDSLAPTDATNFGDAITSAVEAVGSRPGKRAMILLTDGDDTVDAKYSGDPSVWFGKADSTRYQGLLAAQTNDFRIYTVSLGVDISDIGKADLQTFADQTGGTYYAAPTTSSLETPFGQTIPGEIEALPPMETFVLTFPNPYPPTIGQSFDVPFRVLVSYQNANGALTRYNEGSYQVP